MIYSKEFFNTPWFYVLIGLVIVALILSIILTISIKKKANKKSGKKVKVSIDFDIENTLIALGGIENISELEIHGETRLFMKIRDKSKLDKEKLNSLGYRTVEMSEKFILVNEHIDELYDKLNSL